MTLTTSPTPCPLEGDLLENRPMTSGPKDLQLWALTLVMFVRIPAENSRFIAFLLYIQHFQ
jgi:hypothetical protein